MDAPSWPAEVDAAFCEQLVRALNTSLLIRIVADHECLWQACDPGGVLARKMRAPLNGDRTECDRAREVLIARSHALHPAAMAELDRRLPKEG